MESHTPTINKSIDELIVIEIETIAKAIKELERLQGQRNGLVFPLPVIPANPVIPYVPNGPVENNTCGVCWLSFNGPMGYVCNHPGCPSRVSCYTDNSK